MLYPLVICYIAMEHGPFIVDVPIKDDDFPVRYVELPEGKSHRITLNHHFPMVFLWFS